MTPDLRRSAVLWPLLVMLAACNRSHSPVSPASAEPVAPPVATTPSAPDGGEATPATLLKSSKAPVEVIAPATPLLPAGDCSATLRAGDDMRYDATNIDVPDACKTFTLKLVHTGRMPHFVLGHNIVVAKAADAEAVERAGIGAGPYRSYVEPSDTRVIARSRLAGGGQTVSASFPVEKLRHGHYVFFCTFPGHHPAMRGTLTLH